MYNAGKEKADLSKSAFCPENHTLILAEKGGVLLKYEIKEEFSINAPKLPPQIDSNTVPLVPNLEQDTVL